MFVQLYSYHAWEQGGDLRRGTVGEDVLQNELSDDELLEEEEAIITGIRNLNSKNSLYSIFIKENIKLAQILVKFHEKTFVTGP